MPSMYFVGSLNGAFCRICGRRVHSMDGMTAEYYDWEDSLGEEEADGEEGEEGDR